MNGTTIRSVFPPKPDFTENELSDQSGKVFIITGSSGGVGKQLASILYSKNAKVYIAARSKTKAETAITNIRSEHASSSGSLTHLHLDLADLSTIKPSVTNFLSKEARLDILFNNAGVMVPPQGSKTAQGHELQMGTNCLGPFLFTKLLLPLLTTTANETNIKDSVRVVWVSSGAIHTAPKPALDFNNMDYHRDETARVKYERSKCGITIYAAEAARRTKKDGVVHVSLDPGILKTDVGRTMSKLSWGIISLMAHDPKMGACTELFAGMSAQVTMESSGRFIGPFGRLEKCRQDLLGEDLGKKFWEWSEEQVKLYM